MSGSCVSTPAGTWRGWQAGRRCSVTDRGRPVAFLVPVGRDSWEALLASGGVRLPLGEGDVVDEAPRDYGVDASAALAAALDYDR